jgi:hypothetical protein
MENLGVRLEQGMVVVESIKELDPDFLKWEPICTI